MNPPPVRVILFGLGFAALAAVGLTLILASKPGRPVSTPPTASSSDPRLNAGPELSPEEASSGWSHEDVFRRAFWRKPVEGDKIIHSWRKEILSDDGSKVETWQWFIQLQPSTVLLEALRDPKVYGLMPMPEGSTPTVDLGDTALPPEWFPIQARPEFEVLKHPSDGMIVFYDPAAKMLYAADRGHGFASPWQ